MIGERSAEGSGPTASVARAADPVSPSLDDPVIRGASELIGGPAGKRVRVAGGWWNPLRVVVVLAAAGFLLGYLQKVPCIANGWGEGRYLRMCYSDIPPLFSLRGFADGIFPYLSAPPPGQEALEYPALTGMFMALASWITPLDSPEATLWFFNINSLMLLVCLIVAVVATALTVRRRPWDAAMVALAPGTILAATINWDLLAVALLAVAMLFWSRRHPVACGVFLGLATAAKFYPLLILIPLFVLCLRAGRLAAFAKCFGAAAVAWLAINVPFMLINFDGWFHFYSFSSTRGEDLGSIWLAMTNLGRTINPQGLNIWATLLLVVLVAGICVLLLAAPRRPRLAPACFLVIAAFLLVNKVYSPQYVLWLIPLAAMARPRWRDFLIWQACETVYYAAIWLYLAHVLEGNLYSIAIAVRVLGTAWFAAMIIRDMLAPRHDPVRSDGRPEDSDDPGGGVLDGARDVTALTKPPG